METQGSTTMFGVKSNSDTVLVTGILETQNWISESQHPAPAPLEAFPAHFSASGFFSAGTLLSLAQGGTRRVTVFAAKSRF